MADIQVDLGGDVRSENIAAGEARGSLHGTLEKIRSFRTNFNVNDYLSHPIFENLRKQDIGKLFLNWLVPVLSIIVFIWFKSDDPSKTLFGFIILLIFAGSLVIFNGLLLRDTYPLVACILEQLGIVLVCFSITIVVATLLSGPALIIPAFCVFLVLLPFMIPFLPRDHEPVMKLEN